jgi:hypothetical protein
VVARLNVGAGHADAAAFAAQALSIDAVPALLLYPEASPGFLVYKGG